MARRRAPDGNGVLLVDDDVFLTRAWTRILELHGHRVFVTSTLAETETFLAAWADHVCGYVLLDLKLPDGDGAELLALFAALEPKPLVAVVSAHLDYERSLALHGQCAVCVPKPPSMEGVIQLTELLAKSRRGYPGQGYALQLFARKHALDAREAAVVAHLMSGPNIGPDEALGCRLTTVQALWDQVFEKTGYQSQLDVVRAVRRLAAD